MPGITPAMNSLPTEIPVMELYSTIRMEGGMMEPMVADAAVTAVA